MAKQPLRILHLADLHLGSPVCGSSSDPNMQETLRDATFDVWDRAVDLAIQKEVHAVTIGGDSFDNGQPSLRAAHRFAKGLQRLEDAGIPRFLVWGNHDPEGCWPRALAAPLAHCFGSKGMSAAELELDGQVVARIWGYSFDRKEVKNSVVAGWTIPSEPGLWDIGLLHSNFGGQKGHDNYCPTSSADFDGAGVELWLLGHVHSHQEVSGDGWVAAYPGNAQGRTVRETGPKGGLLVELEPGKEPVLTQLPLARVQVADLHVDASGVQDFDELTERVVAALPTRDWPTVIRLHIQGRCDLAGELDRQQALELLGDCLEGADCVVESIRLALEPTREPVDLQGSDFLEALDGILARWDKQGAAALGEEPFWNALAQGVDLDDAEMREEIRRRARAAILASVEPEGMQ